MKLLIIEDEQSLSNSIFEYFSKDGYLCEIASSYKLAFDKISQFRYDCILLDLMLPDGNGLALLEEIKNLDHDCGIIIISAKNAIEDKIKGLQIGADDYLSKPFHLAELSARVYSIIRRKNFSNTNMIKEGELIIDLMSKKVQLKEHTILLTKKEFNLLLFLISNKNWVVSKTAVAEHLSGDTADMFNNHDYVYAHIKNLKKKFVELEYELPIKTIYGMGYKWES